MQITLNLLDVVLFAALVGYVYGAIGMWKNGGSFARALLWPLVFIAMFFWRL